MPCAESERNLGKFYWDGIEDQFHAAASLHEWRRYMQGVYQRLLRNWVKDINRGRGLKTDLFEEAITPHHLLTDLSSNSVGMDCSLKIAQAASRRMTGAAHRPLVVVADLRRLPFQLGVFHYILSGSTLDHFRDKSSIAVSLAELSRVLIPGRVMVVTLDNPHNPIVWLRNILPIGWLNRVKLVPYYVGATYGRSEARREFAAAGLTVTEMTAVAHAPRAPAIWLVAFAERFGLTRLQASIRKVLQSFECLERLPTRYYTGYYLAFRVEKLAAPSAVTLD